MQQPISRRDVYSPSLSASIAGRQVELVSASMDRELPDPLAGGSLRAASGTVVAVEGPDVTSTVATPWDPASSWPPVPQAPASVSMDTGSGPVQVLGDGVVVSASGGTSGRQVSVEVADRYESLNRTISWDAVADAMPSMSEGVEARYVGMQSCAVTDMILRHCGWYSTPPKLPWIMLSAPAQGTMWPENGTVITSQGATGGYPGWLNSPWGVGVTDVDTLYTVGGSYTLATRGRVEMVAMTATRAGQGASRMDIISDTGVLLARMSWSATTGHVYVRQGGAMVAAASVPRTDGILYATIERVSSTSVHAIIRTGSASVSGTASVDSLVTTSVMRQVRVVAASVSGGFQVATPPTSGGLVGWKPNAVLYPRSSSRNSLFVRDSVEGADCADLLAQQCEAEAATYWIDETGVLRWWDLGRLEAQSSVATLTSDDDITDSGFSWSHDLSQVKSRVAVKWSATARDWAWRTTVDLYQGNGSTVQQGSAPAETPAEEIITVPDNEVWIMPDLTLSRMGDANTDAEFNTGTGSFYGAMVTKSDGTEQGAQYNGSFLMSAEKITGRAFKLSTIWTGSLPAVQTSPSLDTPGSGIWRIRRGQSLPIIRGKAKFTLTEQITYSAQSGPVSAPEMVVEAGRWIQRPEQAQYTADYYGARATVPQPVLSSVALVPTPGLQLGDMVEVQDAHVTRLTVRGVVVADSRSISADMDVSHAVAIRPVLVTRNGVTWEEWGRVMNGRTWETWGAQQAGKTWEQWGQAPLAGEDV